MNKYLRFALGISIGAFISLIYVAFSQAASTNTVNIEQKVVELRMYKKVEPEPKPSKKNKARKLLDYGTCSGAFITPYGDILTARHCVEREADLEVLTHDNKTYKATVKAISKVHDLAIIHIDRLANPYFKFAGDVEQGQVIYIRGNPLGSNNVLAQGIIAKLDGDLVFLDCSALPGNSGGPVYDEKGGLVGILTNVHIVGLGVTHLSVAQGQEAIFFFLMSVFGR